jgi:hypothetical protein
VQPVRKLFAQTTRTSRTLYEKKPFDLEVVHKHCSEQKRGYADSKHDLHSDLRAFQQHHARLGNAIVASLLEKTDATPQMKKLIRQVYAAFYWRRPTPTGFLITNDEWVTTNMARTLKAAVKERGLAQVHATINEWVKTTRQFCKVAEKEYAKTAGKNHPCIHQAFFAAYAIRETALQLQKELRKR